MRFSRLLQVFVCLSFLFCHRTHADQKPPFTDYCQRLEQEIQGRKHGFLAGNVSYYVGGIHTCWNLIEDETIGLTHPAHHDLRSRGTGILKSKTSGTENRGLGNDYLGWEFYKNTRVSQIARFELPVGSTGNLPIHMVKNLSRSYRWRLQII